jgi:hypothetical protein
MTVELLASPDESATMNLMKPSETHPNRREQRITG